MLFKSQGCGEEVLKKLNLKPTHKPVAAYYQALAQFKSLKVSHETAVRAAFQNLLDECGRQFGWKLIAEWPIKRAGRAAARVDGALVDEFRLTHGFWEAKDAADDLDREVKKKFEAGYPSSNILFQAPERALLWQNDRAVLDADLTNPDELVKVLSLFFEYQPPAYEQWEQAVADFQTEIPEFGRALTELIEKERRTNKRFREAFGEFYELCRQAINPNLSEQAVEEMLIQHILTERIFRTVFKNPDFTRRNVIAHEIEKVVDALTAQAFSRAEFLRRFDHFYRAIETTAATIEDFTEKQEFLNAVYEKFFQGFSVKVADTHGIVYTPQPVVNFMVRSVEEILQQEFGKTLSSKDVHILDPFTGTGNFIVHIMQEIKRTALPQKYQQEIHCNEVMLLPYYIASMNIEHEFYELTGAYEPFEGICLVDTFELAEAQQISFFTTENTARVERQKRSPIFVVIGNPPYNANQQNEMDLNKNRQHATVDTWIKETYIKDSKSLGRTTRKLLFDPYVKAIRWATNRIGDDGIVCLVTNSSFLEENAFDGMRKHLAKDFNAIYCLDLGGNVRKNPKLSGTTHNVFGIQIGVAISILVKHREKNGTTIYYSNVNEDWKKDQKYKYLNDARSFEQVKWEILEPSESNTWLTKGLRTDFEDFILIGSKEAKAFKGKDTGKTEVVFQRYALGISTNKDSWLYNSNLDDLERNVKAFSEFYNVELDRWHRAGKPKDIMAFLTNDAKKIKWSSILLDKFKRGNYSTIDESKFRLSTYRPFNKRFLYFDKLLIDAPTLQEYFFPTPQQESENLAIYLSDKGWRSPFSVLVVNGLSDLHLCASTDAFQSFPFYTYDEEGTNRRENITDWALEKFRAHYKDSSITKWDIFHYVYGVLHHPVYRERYAANLKRELPRIPLPPPATSVPLLMRARDWRSCMLVTRSSLSIRLRESSSRAWRSTGAWRR